MNTLVTQNQKTLGIGFIKRIHQWYGATKLWVQKNVYLILIGLSAGLGIMLQTHLRKIDPLSAMIDSSIWVVVCYTLCTFVLFHLVSLNIMKFLLRIAKTYTIHSKITKTWYLYFIGGYFLVLYGFLFCLSLWM